LDFLPPLAAVFWFVRNVEMTYFSERCRFYSEMRRCAVLRFGRSAAAGTEADQFHISVKFSPRQHREERISTKEILQARRKP